MVLPIVLKPRNCDTPQKAGVVLCPWPFPAKHHLVACSNFTENLVSWHCGDWDGLGAEPMKCTEAVTGTMQGSGRAFEPFRGSRCFSRCCQTLLRESLRDICLSCSLYLQCCCWFEWCSERDDGKCSWCFETTFDLSLKLTSNVYFKRPIPKYPSIC